MGLRSCEIRSQQCALNLYYPNLLYWAKKHDVFLEWVNESAGYLPSMSEKIKEKCLTAKND